MPWLDFKRDPERKGTRSPSKKFLCIILSEIPDASEEVEKKKLPAQGKCKHVMPAKWIKQYREKGQLQLGLPPLGKQPNKVANKLRHIHIAQYPPRIILHPGFWVMIKCEKLLRFCRVSSWWMEPPGDSNKCANL